MAFDGSLILQEAIISMVNLKLVAIMEDILQLFFNVLEISFTW